ELGERCPRFRSEVDALGASRQPRAELAPPPAHAGSPRAGGDGVRVERCPCCASCGPTGSSDPRTLSGGVDRPADRGAAARGGAGSPPPTSKLRLVVKHSIGQPA